MQGDVRQETHRVRCACGAWAQLRIARLDGPEGATDPTVVMFCCPNQSDPEHACSTDDRLLDLIPRTELQIDPRVLDPAFPSR